jgi:uncharacterized membrane protein YesL
MIEIPWFDKLRKRLTFNRLGRLNTHFLAIQAAINPKTANDKAEVDFFCSEFTRYYRRTKRLSNLRTALYLLLYAAIIVNLLKAFAFLAVFVAFVELGHALFGTTLLVAAIFLLTARINLNLQLMEECMMHLISIYHQNPKRNTTATLEKIARAI